MPRRPRKVPSAHGEALGPAAALRALGRGGRVVRAFGGNANMHWLVEGVHGAPGVDKGLAVLRRYGPWRGPEEVAWELRVLEGIAALGWRVPCAVGEPVRVGRHLWCLFEYVRGGPRRPRTEASEREDQRRRGRLLAALHADLARLTDLTDLGQRPGWVRRDEVLGMRPDGPSVEEVVRERVVAEDAAVMLAYAERARARFAAVGAVGVVGADRLPVQVVHGDLIGGNVLYVKGELSGVIDFDFTRVDLRVADFAWTWRGKNDDFVRGYEEVAPLTEAERALVAPAYWVSLLESARLGLLLERGPERTQEGLQAARAARAARVPMPGIVAALQRRSELMGE